MGDVFSFDKCGDEPERNLDVLWAVYFRARKKAELTGAIEDGVAAGKAWAAWLHVYLR
jgi:hypothetical protein